MTGTIYLGANEYSVGEREGFVTITIKRDGDTSGAVAVSYATNPDGATPGLDYTAMSGSAVIAAGATSTTIRIPILNDSLGETTEKFNVSLINVDSGTLLFPRTTLVSILDDENPVVEPSNPPQTSPYTVKTVDAVTGLDGPMQIEWIEDTNLALVSEKEGRIKIVNFDTGTMVSTLLDITGKVNSDADRGLLDIALHPDLENNPYLYAYYVVDPADVKASGAASADNLGNRYAHLVRYELDMSGAVPTIRPGSETVMLGGAGTSLNDISGGGALDYTDPIHSDKRASDVNADGTYKQDYIKVDSRSHAGGAIAFGPDGALYVSTGDGTSYNYADPRTASVQNVNSLSGKILRIDPITGDGFADNPYATANLDANASKVWQMGLRNPYAMTFTDDGRIMISETGWYSWEEINSGGKGANYGWPYYEGADNGEINKTPGYQTMPGASLFYTNVANGTIVVTPAFRAFSHTGSDPGYQMSAIVGGTSVYDGDKYPEIFKGDYFFSDIVDGDIFTVDVNDRTKMQYVTNIGTYHAVSFVEGPDGYVYYSDITGNKIVRLEITDPNAVPNRAPVVANAIADTTGTVGTALSITIPATAFSDPDGDSLELAASLPSGQALPSWLTFNAATRTFAGTPPAGQTGPIDIRVTAVDPDGATVNDVFRLTIGGTATNQAPIVATPAADQGATVGVNWSYKLPAGTFADADNDALSLVAAQANGQGLPSWVAFNAQTGTFSGTPPSGVSGTFTFRVTATDPKGAAVSDDFVLTVNTAAETVVNDVASQNQFLTGATTNDVFRYAGSSSLYQWGATEDGQSIVVWTRSATDNTYDVLTGFEKLRFSDKTVDLKAAAPEGPDYLDIADTIQTLTGKTTADRFIINGTSTDYAWGNTADGKSLVIWTVSATDDTYDVLTAFDQLVFTDKTVYLTGTPPANAAPVLAKPIADYSVPASGAGMVFTYAIPAGTFTDANGDTLTYTATQADGTALPSWLTFDAANGLFRGQPPQFNTVSVKVTASDGKGGTASDVFDIAMAANNPPVVTNPVADQTFAPGQAFSISLSQTFTDADNDPMLFFVTLADGSALPSWITVSDNGRTLSGTAPASAAPLTLKVSANDRNGGSASDEFVVNVTGPNVAPIVANPIVDKVTAEEAQFTFTLPANTFTDANGDAITLAARTAAGTALPTWLKFDAATRTFSGTPNDADVGKLAVEVTASDGKGGLVTDSFDLTITAVNDAPRLSQAIVDQTGQSGAEFSFALPSATFVDVDNSTLTLSATLADGTALPTWLKFNAATGLFSGIPADAQVGSLTIKVTANDPSGLSASDEFKLTIGAKPGAETLYQNTTANQNIDAGDGTDVFVLGGNSSTYSWGPTQDGKGIVIWDSKGFDVLFNFEELRFTNKSVSVASILGTGGSDMIDDPESTQYLAGKGTADRFIIDALSTDYGWGKTADGKGVVVWHNAGDNAFDILTGFEKLVFDDREVDISGLGQV
ncbi:putative Ig domain-containing protein [Devosia sp. SL43]|uniref:putative Ig domain-containing protein n=1 Tax=Devosia sp. SL43 TaxID=2806348 RepID=UPI001F165604|nr:putative Ig domain-containing protein [Devosia sp. SL43]UJW85359.1 putative Ig domain-containing protein [Devosia sp. SL43]